MLRRCTLAVSLTLIWAARLCNAQAVSIAELGGTVTDPSGAPISGAQVRATETEKQQVRNTVSDSQGRYTLPNLPVGPYRLEVTGPGFKTYVQNGIVLQVGNSVTVNVQMQLGSLSESVQVEASAGMVETKENAVSQVIDERRIVDLPLNGRQPTQLILLSGAALTTPGGGMTGSKNYFSSTTISVAGGQANGVNYLLDGGDNNDSFTNVNLPIPFPDALQEFSVQTSSLPARFGLHPGAVVNAVTKSGTNDLHGSLFEFLRNGDLNARNTFAPVHDSLKRNQFGGTLGGRVIKDKLFFFAGYQGTRQRSDPPQTTSFVPNAAVLAGDFSVIDAAASTGGCVSGSTARTLKDPTTGLAFPGNQIPVNRFNPQSLNLLKYIPSSSDKCGKLTYGIPTTGDENQEIARIDWVQNAKHSLYGRYFVAGYKNPPVFDGKNLLTTTQAGNFERAQTITLADTYSFSPTLLNSFHATANRRRDDRGVAENVINPRSLGLNIAAPVPNFILATVSNYFSVGCGTCAPAHFNVNSFHFADDVDWIHGRHQLAFGVNIIRDQMNVVNSFQRNGNFNFNGTITGDALADFMLGLQNDYTQSDTLDNATRATVIALYAQDSIKIARNLTINAGLRWEPTFPAYDYFARGDSFSRDAFAAGRRSTRFTNAPVGLLFYGDEGVPKSYSQGSMFGMAPRLGLVWDPKGDGKQTLRVSGAILRDTAEVFYNERLTTNAPWGNQIDIPNPVGGFTNPFQGYPGGNPFPSPVPPPANFPFPAAGIYVNMPLKIHPTYTAQWNASFQRQITANWLASASYMGNKTTHIWVGEDINPAVYIPGASTTGNTNQRRLLYRQNPVAGAAYASITESDQGGNGHYHGLLLSIQHRFSKGFTLLTNYTWSHCISEVDFTGELTGSQYQDPFNRHANIGNCNFDVRHNFNTSLVAQTPGMGGKFMSAIVKGWQIAPILSVRSGIAINVTTGTDASLTGVNQDRPNLILSSPYPETKTTAAFLNRAAFQANAAGTYGNLGRDAVNGPRQLNFDVALSRIFKFTERWRLEARGEAFNVINHANYGNPTTALNSSNFGRILPAGDPRLMQLGMKLKF
jgi:hypothetical protein